MTCTEARQQWNLYHDSEGDAELHFQVNEHLAMCAGSSRKIRDEITGAGTDIRDDPAGANPQGFDDLGRFLPLVTALVLQSASAPRAYGPYLLGRRYRPNCENRRP